MIRVRGGPYSDHHRSPSPTACSAETTIGEFLKIPETSRNLLSGQESSW